MENTNLLPPRYLLKTLGCKANLYDSQLIEAELNRRGWQAADSESSGQATLCIVNSCTVTDEADRQSRKLASRLGRLNQKARVVVTGCAAEVDPERIAASKGIHYVVGNQNKAQLVDLVLKAIERGMSEDKQGEVLGQVSGYSQMLSRHPVDREWNEPTSTFVLPPVGESGSTGRTRAFLKIQEGCNSFCTYCVIPYGRGPNRSLPIEQALLQVNQLVAAGAREVVLTGTNLGDYGTDWGQAPAFDELLEKIFDQTNLERLRVSSLDPTEITPRTLALMKKEPRLCPHFHVSLQSPNTKVLRLMKRKYSAVEVERTLLAIADIPAPVGGVFAGMDIITGFPGETEEDFTWGVQRLKELPWSRLHVFPFSERAGTPATRLPYSVSHAERERRAGVLRELSLQRLTSIYQSVLQTCQESGRLLEGILLESPAKMPQLSGNWYSGYTPNYLRVFVRVPDFKNYENQVVSASAESILTDANSGDVALLGSAVLG